jgi:hypothetical protein
LIYLTALQIDKALRDHFAKNGYVCLSQVRNGTGFEKRQVRTADMLAISTWPSRGLFTEGIEVKVSTGDLARELANPAKAEEIAQYCTYWWIAGPDGIAEKTTLPDNWGLITVNDKLKAKVSIAAKRMQPKPMDELFVCACLRSFVESHVAKSEVEEQVKAGIAEAVERVTKRNKDRLKELEEAVAEFNEHSGINLLSDYGHKRYDLKDIGEAVKVLANLRDRNVMDLKRMREDLEAGIGVVDLALNTLHGLTKGATIP